MIRRALHLHARRSALSVVLGGLVACASEPAVDGVQILPPDDVEFSWDLTLNARGDGLGAVIPVDVMVYDGLTGAPLPDVPVTVDALYAEVLSEGVWAEASGCRACQTFWDAHLDRTVVLDRDALEVETTLSTDDDGMVRLYAVIDELPIPPGEGSRFEPARLRVSVGEEQAVVLLEAH